MLRWCDVISSSYYTQKVLRGIYIKRETGANVGRTLPMSLLIIYSSRKKRKQNQLFICSSAKFLDQRDESAVSTRAQTSKIYFHCRRPPSRTKNKTSTTTKVFRRLYSSYRRWALYTVGLLKHSLCVSHCHLSNPYTQQHAVYIIKRI